MSLPFDKRNAEDYLVMSARLRAGLARIADERTASGEYQHSASSKVLAQLAGCSVATIYARQASTVFDPIAELRSIKAARRDEQRRKQVSPKPRRGTTQAHVREVSDDFAANAKLRVDLGHALDEATRWHHLHEEVAHAHRALTALNSRLIEKIAVLERRIGELMQQAAPAKSEESGHKPFAKVTPIIADSDDLDRLLVPVKLTSRTSFRRN